MVQRGELSPSKWPAENDELSHKTNLHCSLPATNNNNIIGGKYDGITHCSMLAGTMPDRGHHVWLSLTMTEHFQRCLGHLEAGRILRTHLDGHYVFDTSTSGLFHEVSVPPYLAGEDPTAVEVEEQERAEETVCYSIGYGAAESTPAIAPQEGAAAEPPLRLNRTQR